MIIKQYTQKTKNQTDLQGNQIIENDSRLNEYEKKSTLYFFLKIIVGIFSFVSVVIVYYIDTPFCTGLILLDIVAMQIIFILDLINTYKTGYFFSKWGGPSKFWARESALILFIISSFLTWIVGVSFIINIFLIKLY